MSRDSFVWPNLPQNARVGPFVLLKQITNEGNMSRTYVARYASRPQKLVIKIARADQDVFVNFIRDEVDQLRHLRHPGIVHLYPISIDDKVVAIGRATQIANYFHGYAPWYYIMEWLPGGSLQHHYKRLLDFPIEWKIEFIYQVALVLHYMHLNGIAHLDLKMENIVFRTPPDKNVKPDPVLVDFGLASRYNHRPRDKAGTLMYLSPDRVEDIKGIRAHYSTSVQKNNIDHRPADIWALGVIAYELLTGTYPFKPYENEESLAVNILHKPVPAMGEHFHPDLEHLILGEPVKDANQYDRRAGMLSKVRENRLNALDVIELLDTDTPYMPPRLG